MPQSHDIVSIAGQLHAGVGEGAMVRAGRHLAAAAIAAALLLAGAGAVASADTTGESAGGESGSSTAADSGPAEASHPDTGTFSGNERPTATAGDQADSVVEHPATEAAGSAPEKSGDEPTEEKPAVVHDHCSDECPGKTVNKAPAVPQAPPPMDLAPLPEAPAAPVLEAPPPADLPPAIPAAPVDPNTVDSVPGEGRHHPVGNEPPVLTVPVVVAAAPIPPVRLGASIAPRWTTGERTVESLSAGEAAPQLLRASANERLLNESSFTSLGVTAPGQLPYRTGYSDYSPRRLATMAGGALPGLAGLVLITAAGICLGYRQANMAQQLRTNGAARFLS
jgi:hypothetical protein